MLRKPPSSRFLVGVTLAVIMTFIRLFVSYNYVPGIVYDVWFWLSIYLAFLPIDGVVAELYGFWSAEELIAFFIGFLPSTFVPIVYTARFGWTRESWRIIFSFLLLGLGMGLMGFGGAKYREDRRKGWLVGGLFLWLLFFLLFIISGFR